jgi:glycine C-acetyltransferase
MLGSFEQHVESTLGEIRSAGLWKPERVLDSPQRPDAELHGGAKVMVLCANNYLGLADHPDVIAAAHAGLDLWG